MKALRAGASRMPSMQSLANSMPLLSLPVSWHAKTFTRVVTALRRLRFRQMPVKLSHPGMRQSEVFAKSCGTNTRMAMRSSKRFWMLLDHVGSRAPSKARFGKHSMRSAICTLAKHRLMTSNLSLRRWHLFCPRKAFQHGWKVTPLDLLNHCRHLSGLSRFRRKLPSLRCTSWFAIRHRCSVSACLNREFSPLMR